MAWSKGDLITASKLNSENSSIYYSTSGYEGWSSTSVTSPWFYVHHNTGAILYMRVSGTAYWFAKGTIWYEYKSSVSGTVNRVTLWSKTNTTNKTISQTIYAQNVIGAGWYRAYAYADRGSCEVHVYWPQTNCVKGNRLVYWDNPQSSANRIIGTVLTTSVLNSGRVGTM